MQLDFIPRGVLLLAVCASLVACSDAADRLSAPRASDEPAPIDTVVGSRALAIPSATGAWWTYSVVTEQGDHRSVQRVELGAEIAPDRFALSVSVLAAHGPTEAVFGYTSWRFGTTFSGTALTGEEVTFFAPELRWTGPGIMDRFEPNDEVGATNGAARYGRASSSRPTFMVAPVAPTLAVGALAAVEEHYAKGVGFVMQAVHRCAGTTCEDSTIELLSWSFRQPASLADRLCRDDLTGRYDNGLLLIQSGTTVTGFRDLLGGGTPQIVSGTRTPTTLSLRYYNKGGVSSEQDDVVDYAIHPTGLSLRPPLPGEPILMRTCTFGEL